MDKIRLRPFLRANWPLLLATLIFLIMALTAVAKARALTDGFLIYSLDDAYIHMAMAKNLVRHGVWGVTQYHFSSSSTSLLWTALLGLAYALTGVNIWAPLVLNLLFCFFTLLVAHRLMLHFYVSRWLGGLTLVGMVMAAPMGALVLIGMEHGLHLWLTIWFAGAAVMELTEGSPGRTGLRRFPSLAVLGGLLAASRYEGLFLVGTVCLFLAFRRRLGYGVVVGAAAVVPLILFGLVSRASRFFVLPNPVMLKASGPSVSFWKIFFKPVGTNDWTSLRSNPALLFLTIAGLIMVVIGLYRRKTFWHGSAIMPFFLVLMIFLHLHYGFSYTTWVYRYAIYLEVFGIFTAAAALSGWGLGAKAKGRWSLIQTAVLAAVIVMTTNISEAMSLRREIGRAADNYLQHVSTATFVRRFYPRHPVVFNDIGAVCFYTEAEVLDMFGLGSIEPMIYRRSGSYEKEDVLAWTRARGAQIAVLQVRWHLIAPRIPDEWIKVAEMVVPRTGNVVGFFAVDPSFQLPLRRQLKWLEQPWASRHRLRLRFFDSPPGR